MLYYAVGTGEVQIEKAQSALCDSWAAFDYLDQISEVTESNGDRKCISRSG